MGQRPVFLVLVVLLLLVEIQLGPVLKMEKGQWVVSMEANLLVNVRQKYFISIPGISY